LLKHKSIVFVFCIVAIILWVFLIPLKINGEDVSNIWSVNRLEEEYADSATHIFADDTLNKRFIKTSITIKDKPSQLEFILDHFRGKVYTTDVKYSYDKDTIRNYFENYNKVQTATKDAEIKYVNNSFTTTPEVNGTQVDIDKLLQAVSTETNGIKIKDYYIKPSLVLSDVKDISNEANTYLNSSIEYTCNKSFKLEPSDITFHGRTLNLNKTRLVSFCKDLADYYDTQGQTVKLHDGSEISVQGGTYRAEVDTDAECEEIVKLLKSGNQTKGREPITTGKTVSKYDGKYTVEVDIASQHVWVYTHDGQAVMDSDCVTGKLNKHGTPTGSYTISEMRKNYTMHGTNDNGTSYASHCSCFMRITNSGVALHDANWRSRFDGNIYTYDGSHGCVNLPTKFAKDLFDTIDKGTLVIVH
jgi:lipoprotein-anchoring transpeptidase ErfK/SrfK